MDPTEHTGPVIDSGAETQQTRSINPTNTTVNGWLVDTCDSTGSGASPRPTSGIAWPRQGISLDIGEASGGPSGPIALDDLTDVDTQTTAATDGQALVWDTQTQLWKPGTVSGGGEGGAVDSVNGETGVVSLGIQDMDDFEPDTDIETLIWTNPNTANPGSDEFRLYSSGFARLSTTTSAGYKKDELLAYLQIGSNVELVVNSVTHTATVTVAAVLEDAGSATERVYCTFNATPALSDTILTDSALVINFLDQSSAIPLAEGDILQWDNVDQKFKPAQLPSGGGGAVDSVNGETGVVELGIQDMDDFELNSYPTVSVSLTTLSSSCAADGQFGSPMNNNGNVGDYFLYYGGGNDYVQFSKLTAGDSITFTFDDGSQHTTTFVTTAVNGGSEWYMTLATDWPAQAFATQTMDVASPVFGANSFTSLAEGDILQWNDADQKFKPAQLPTGGGGAVDSVNGETGVVSLGIQDMDDFAYDREIGSYSGNTDKTVGSVDTPGEWDMGSAPGFSYFSWHNDQSGAMDTLVNGTAVTFSSTGLPDHSTTVVTNPTTNDANSRYVQLQDEWPQEYIDAPSGTPLVVTAPPLPSFPIQPPVDGSVLQWNEVDQKFKPAQLLLPPLPAGNGRATGTATAATLADAAAANLEITALGSAGMFLKVTTSHAAWVRFYADATTRAADTRTDSSVAPTRGDGVLLEVITTGAESYMVTPAVHYFQATPTSGTMHVKVTNRSGAEADIQVDVEALVLEP